MSRQVNQTLLEGFVGNDPERRGDNGPLTFRMATEEEYEDRDGKVQTRTDWHSVVVWGKPAETLAGALRKGSLVMVRGSNRTREYEKDGVKRYVTEVVAERVGIVPTSQTQARDEPRREQDRRREDRRPAAPF